MAKKEKKIEWRERLIEVRVMKAGDLKDHSLNPKIHGQTQRDCLNGILQDVGKVDILKAYYSERNGGDLTLWDGHCRSQLNKDQQWHVGIYDLDDSEADLLLATFDPIGWQAEQSRAKVEQLLRDVKKSQGIEGVIEVEAQRQNIVLAKYAVPFASEAKAQQEPDRKRESSAPQLFPLAITINRPTLEKWKAYKESIGAGSDTSAFEELLLKAVAK